jgi:methylmalonyl-CoA/ethylmalonyl-CoA epimerase
MDLRQSRVEQLLIPVTDLESAIPWYRDVLGLQFLFSAPPQMSFFQCGTTRLLVGVPESPDIKRCGAIYFGVDDIHAVHETLSSRGVAFDQKPHVIHRTPQMEIWLAEFHDPDGNPLALMGTRQAQG